MEHRHDVLAVAWRPDGKRLASSTLDGQIYIWNPHENELLVGCLCEHELRSYKTYLPGVPRCPCRMAGQLRNFLRVKHLAEELAQP